ncbi:MAG: septal ring lytic transglycosylase RlpA family lipoprotein [Gammaproteobacteria bacterium]|nr:septal ring lytic transglycosylase RlpA family lipoprotein [Gammaproteobacteria bacterium]
MHSNTWGLFFFLLTSLMLGGCEVAPVKQREPGTYEVFGKTYRVMENSLGYREIGIASWYGTKFHGNLTANGETYDMYGISAAHKVLPLPTFVKVTNLDNGKSLVLRVNDRGPFHDDRVVDLSWEAARQLGFDHQGTAPVVVEALDKLNYPERTEAEASSSFYLQVGAFSDAGGAMSLLSAIQELMDKNGYTFNVQALVSEIDTGVLHKVWIGPIHNELYEHELAVIIEAAGMGNPLKVETD